MGVSGQRDHELANGFAWDAKSLQFAVREPFPSNTTGTELVFGSIDNGKPLELELSLIHI